MSVDSAAPREAVLRKAGRQAGLLAWRHKVITAAVAVFVVAAIVVSLVASGSAGSPAASHRPRPPLR